MLGWSLVQIALGMTNKDPWIQAYVEREHEFRFVAVDSEDLNGVPSSGLAVRSLCQQINQNIIFCIILWCQPQWQSHPVPKQVLDFAFTSLTFMIKPFENPSQSPRQLLHDDQMIASASRAFLMINCILFKGQSCHAVGIMCSLG